MYKLTSKNLKVYWCANFEIAQKVAKDLTSRYSSDIAVVEVPEKTTWISGSSDKKEFFADEDIAFSCSNTELFDALAHSRDEVVKIQTEQEIFCFSPTDPFWQTRYDRRS